MPELNRNQPLESGGFDRLMQILVPGFVRRIDQYFLINYPVVWRTRAHILALAHGLLILLAFGFLYLTTRQPSISLLSPFLLLVLFLLELAVLWPWQSRQERWPMGDWEMRKYLLTWVSYCFSIFMMFIPLGLVVWPDLGVFADEFGFKWLIFIPLYAALLVMASLPKHLFPRMLERYSLYGWLLRRLLSWPGSRFRQPTFIRRLDQRLLTTRPLVWSTSIHKVLFNGVVYGTLLSISIATVIHILLSLDLFYFLNVIKTKTLTVIIIPSALFFICMLSFTIRMQYLHTIRCRKTIELLLIINICSVSLFIVSLIPAYIFNCLLRDCENSIIITFFILYASIIHVGLFSFDVYDEHYSNPVCWSLPPVAFILFLFVANSGSEAIFLTVLLTALSGEVIVGMMLTVFNARKYVSHSFAIVSRVYIVVAPTIAYWLVRISSVMLDANDEHELLTPLATLAIFFIISLPAIRMLIRYQYQPREK